MLITHPARPILGGRLGLAPPDRGLWYAEPKVNGWRAMNHVSHLPNLHFRLNYLGDKAGIEWRQNALRHSYASYRLADTSDAARVALEMGNSPEKLFRHYRELVTADAAKEWFAIVPPQE